MSEDMLPTHLESTSGNRRARRVALMDSSTYTRILSTFSVHGLRYFYLDDLLASFDVKDRLICVQPAKASAAHLQRFHSERYVEALRKVDTNEQREDAVAFNEAEYELYGFVDDCAPWGGVWLYATTIVAASLQAADLLVRGQVEVALNFGGGRHHAKKSEATGFCFVNDCALAIIHLLQRFQRVLYVDIDIHHGDGVQEAFWQSNRVLCVSFHHFARGFFPGTGRASEVGEGDGFLYNLNLPIKAGLSDGAFISLYQDVFSWSISAFKPDAIVLCCGADTLADDPLGCWNLTSLGVAEAVRITTAVSSCGTGTPLLILGGGGYNASSTARTWTAVTVAALGRSVEERVLGSGAATGASIDIPATAHYFEAHRKSGFTLHTKPSLGRIDKNTHEYLKRLRTHARRALKNLRVRRCRMHLPVDTLRTARPASDTDIDLEEDSKVSKRQCNRHRSATQDGKSEPRDY